MNQLWPQSVQLRFRTVVSASRLFVATARIWLLLHRGQNIGTIGAFRPRQMDFGQWMAAEIPPEKQFQIEKQCRDLQRHPEVGMIAAKLLKQCYHQQEMLQAAVNEIARLELLLM